VIGLLNRHLKGLITAHRRITELRGERNLDQCILTSKIYQKRGLDSHLSMEVAKQLSRHDALGAHAKDELGINEFSQPRPLLAALASGASFISGGLLPFLVSLFAPVSSMVILLYAFAIVFLAISGGIAAKAGGSSLVKGIVRICFWGTIAMGITALAGYLFGVKTS
jgi:VIT1/CCC1 family predicted Fe2+/Mn2+ transporter